MAEQVEEEVIEIDMVQLKKMKVRKYNSRLLVSVNCSSFVRCQNFGNRRPSWGSRPREQKPKSCQELRST